MLAGALDIMNDRPRSIETSDLPPGDPGAWRSGRLAIRAPGDPSELSVSSVPFAWRTGPHLLLERQDVEWSRFDRPPRATGIPALPPTRRISSA